MSLWKPTRDLWHHAEPRERVKLALGRILYPGATRAWLSFVHADELLWRQAHRLPQFVTRIYRPYALRTLSSGQRVQHMIGHYTSLHRLGLRALLEQSVDAPLRLVDLPTKSQTPAHLQLVSIHDGHREGEAHLHLVWNGQLLYALSFLLRPHGSGCQMVVTRLQGTGHPQARELVREATKGLHGLRPSVLMAQAARQMALSMGCNEVLLVSNRHRVALNPMRRWKMQSDLEGLWQELGAHHSPCGLFTLSPVVEVPQDFSSVASNKRAEARRKAELLQLTLSGIDQQVRALARPVASA